MARRDAGNVVQGERPAVAGRATVMSRPHSAFINEICKPTEGKRESSHQLSHGCRGLQLRPDGVRGHWRAEQMTLSLMAAVRPDLLHLLFCLDTFGDDNLVEARAETGNCADDRLGITFFPEAGNKRLVDLDLLEGKLAQVIE
jgi:hypothetical protein